MNEPMWGFIVSWYLGAFTGLFAWFLSSQNMGSLGSVIMVITSIITSLAAINFGRWINSRY